MATFAQFGNLRVNPEVYARFSQPTLATFAIRFGNLREFPGENGRFGGNLRVDPEENAPQPLLIRAHGFITGRSTVTNARPHTSKGVVVNERPGVPRKLVRKLRAILHNAQRTGLAVQNRDNHPYFESWYRGMVNYVNMVNQEQGRPLVDALEKLRA